MNSVKDSRSFIITWNNTFPLDKWYREKYKIRFNSEEHRRTCQIDIYYEWLEEQVYKEYEVNLVDSMRKAEDYAKGIWIKEKVVTEDENSQLFDEIDLSTI
jgi:hypothetical protein